MKLDYYPDKPNQAGTAAVSARPGWVSRIKLSEPVRLYLYGLAVVALLGLTLAGTLTGEWADYWVRVAGVLLVIPATEAARASVFSPTTHVQDLIKAAATPRTLTVPRGVNVADVADRIRAAGL